MTPARPAGQRRSAAQAIGSSTSSIEPAVGPYGSTSHAVTTRVGRSWRRRCRRRRTHRGPPGRWRPPRACRRGRTDRRAPTVTTEPSIAGTVLGDDRAPSARRWRPGPSARVRLAPRDQRAVGAVRPVGERLGDGLHTRPVAQPQQRRTRRGEHRQRRVVLVRRRPRPPRRVPDGRRRRGTARRAA